MIKILDMKLMVFLFLAAFIAANLIVKHFGIYGLVLSSFVLIPFDFVCRCLIHEKLQGKRLVLLLSGLTVAAAVITYIINRDALRVALGSIAGFTAAQFFAGAFYQNVKREGSWFLKVNISDLIAIVFDSIAFQLVAFNTFDPLVLIAQMGIKFAGGLLWYYIIFKWTKVHIRFLYGRDRYNERVITQHLKSLGYYGSRDSVVVGCPPGLPKADPKLTLKENYELIQSKIYNNEQ
jgi:uncharacterized PurR-regulated membrane protein YhhQ (DUF165 family)